MPRLFFAAVLVLASAASATAESPAPPHRLLPELERLVGPLIRDRDRFAYTIEATASAPMSPTQPRVEKGAGPDHRATVHVDRYGPDAWSLRVRSEISDFELWRQRDRTVLKVPAHRVAFVGAGPLAAGADSLAPRNMTARLCDAETILGSYLTLLALGGPQTLFDQFAAPHLTPDGPDAGSPTQWRVGEELLVSLAEQGITISAQDPQSRRWGVGAVSVTCRPEPDAPSLTLEGMEVREIDRTELERMLFRAMRRALSVWLPGPKVLARPAPRKVEHGELRHVDDHLLLLVHGTPQQIGRATAALVGDRFRRTIDSTIHLVGAVETIRSGKWFLAELDDAWGRLSPHIPRRHLEELEAMAQACPDVSLREARLANVFPEYFHCSGFALFGRATRDGVLYHGRVLDYMTVIGLQQAAVTVVCRPDDAYGFASAGYAGFLGVVSGMNERQISVGEMGGGGRYQWDGIPMATMMRMALEQCASLDEVRDLWRRSPRTCEYYYVFADGKAPSAVGVRATPDELEFIEPGAAHPRLGSGIPDAVVMSGGSRLEKLRRRIESAHGSIDARTAIDLMARPVSMSSNLHNVLFAPQSSEIWIANASSRRPAAEMPYVRYDLGALLAEIDARVAAAHP